MRKTTTTTKKTTLCNPSRKRAVKVEFFNAEKTQMYMVSVLYRIENVVALCCCSLSQKF